MYANLEELMQNRVFYNFAEINKIPRCNGHEQKLVIICLSGQNLTI